MPWNDYSYTGPAYVIVVDGKPTDVRSTPSMAIRQGKVRKSDNPTSLVDIHYADASTATYHDGTQLTVRVCAEVSPQTLIATVKS